MMLVPHCPSHPKTRGREGDAREKEPAVLLKRHNERKDRVEEEQETELDGQVRQPSNVKRFYK